MTQKDNGPWFTADLHFNHNAILQYTHRGLLFSDMPSHNQWIVSRINETVGPRGTLYFGGDIAFGSKWEAAALIEQIETPNKFLVCGNHDDRLVDFYKSSGLFKEVHEHRLYIKHDGVNIVLNHFPEVEWSKCQHGSWMLHGHCHGDFDYEAAGLQDNKIVDIGWDASPAFSSDLDAEIAHAEEYGYMSTARQLHMKKYRPISFSEIRALFADRVNRPHHGGTR